MGYILVLKWQFAKQFCCQNDTTCYEDGSRTASFHTIFADLQSQTSCMNRIPLVLFSLMGDVLRKIKRSRT